MGFGLNFLPVQPIYILWSATITTAWIRKWGTTMGARVESYGSAGQTVPIWNPIDGDKPAARAEKEVGGGSWTFPPVANHVSQDTMKVFSAVDSFMNLGNSDRLSGFASLSPEEKDKFLQVLAKLVKSGFVGYEVLEIDGQPTKCDIDMQIGDRRTYGAKRYTDYQP